jgi:membrane-bound inhibitor of C-type lysozyme
MQSNGNNRFWMVIAVFVVLAGLIAWDSRHSNQIPQVDADSGVVADDATSTDMAIATAPASTATVYTYMCDAKKTLTVTLHLPADDFVNVHLGDGRTMILAHTISADGARYANASGKYVFWAKGNAAFFEENGTTTYSGCLATQS